MTLRIQRTLIAVLCALASACNSKPTTDLSEAAYGRAVGQFAMLSGETKDLTYRDARFDQVLEALDQVPPGSGSDRARALAQHIRLARMNAEQAEQKSKQDIREATAPPLFVPGAHAAMPAPIPPKSAATARQTPTLTATATVPGSAAPTAQMPDWYQQAGYGQAAAPPPAAPAEPPPDSETEQAQSPGKTDASAHHSPSSEAASDGGSWRIYGLPGPAQKAMGGSP